MPQARGVISHVVGLAGDVTSGGVVTVVTLVYAVQAQQMGRSFGSCCGFLVAPDGGVDVVSQWRHRPASKVDILGQHVVMHHFANQL